MKSLILALMLAVALSVPSAFAAEKDFADKTKIALVSVWNIVPAALRVVNKGLHLIVDPVHDGLHAVSEALEITLEE